MVGAGTPRMGDERRALREGRPPVLWVPKRPRASVANEARRDGLEARQGAGSEACRDGPTPARSGERVVAQWPRGHEGAGAAGTPGLLHARLRTARALRHIPSAR